MVHMVGFRDLPNDESGEEREEAVRYQIARGGRGGGEACLVRIRRASAAAIAARRNKRAPSESVGIIGMLGGVVATPVGGKFTWTVAVTVLLAVAMTETLLEAEFAT